MTPQLLPESVLGIEPAQDDPQLPLESLGVQRYIWESRFGPMVIEVEDGAVFVNRKLVEPHALPPDAE